MERDHSNNYGDDFSGSNPWNYNANEEDITSHTYLRRLAQDVLADYAELMSDDTDADSALMARDEVAARLEHDLPYLNKDKPVHIDLSTSRYYMTEPGMPFDAKLSMRNLAQPDEFADMDDPAKSIQISGLFVGFGTLEQFDPNHRPDEYSIGLTMLDDKTLNPTFVPLSTLLDNIIKSERG